MSDVTSNGSFMDRRVFLVRGNDARCMSYWPEDAASSEQSTDGPTYLVIGRNAPDDKLPKLALRYGYTVEELKAFRDGVEQAEVAHG